MTSGRSPTRIIAPRRVQRRRPRREVGGAERSSDIGSIIAAAEMQNAECRIQKWGAILHSEFCILNSMLGLYIHLPFCRVHCAYCPFAVSTHIGLQDEYTAALVGEIEERVTGLRGCGVAEEVDTIFFGGGTPSRTSVENLRRIIDALRAGFAISAGAEFSLEANPEDVVTGLLGSSVGAGGPAPVQIAAPVTQQPSNPATPIAVWRSLGVNRLSIGVQSFHDAELRPLGRVHGRERALEAIRDAVASGIRTSIDLILGLPNQTADSFRETLDIAIGSGVGHLSLY